MMEKIKYNKQQLSASEFQTGPRLVIAGAGTGKTKTLILTLKNILSKNDNTNVLLLTFSKKAAQEIKDRIDDETDINCDKRVYASTFHSFCYSVIRKNFKIFQKYNNYNKVPSIISEEKKIKVISSFVKKDLDSYFGLPVNVIMSVFEKKELLKQVKVKELKNNLKDLLNRYDDYLEENNLIEFERIINAVIRMLKYNSELKEYYSNRFSHILVDEFQDTSENNFELLRLLLNNDKNLFAVGDDFQLIYSFRNSQIKYILKLKKYFKNLKVYKLFINYRSHQEIVKLSNDFIQNNKHQSKKKLKSFKGKGGCVEYRRYYSYEEMIAKIEEKIISFNNNTQTAIIYRNNWIGKKIECLKEKFPHLEMMTIHASKGLEFENVIIAGVDDKIIPSPWSDLEEERRLFYVAMTRAKKGLFIFYKMSFEQYPRFIQELGE